MMEEIPAKEEEHAEKLADLLFAVDPSTGKGARLLYFPDEIGSAKGEDDGGTRESPASRASSRQLAAA